MMSYINETDFVIENKELVYPEIITDGLQLYYDAKGKRDTDYHRDTMLDMSGNKNHGKLHNFAYEKHSGYRDGLVFDYIDDKLVRPALNLQPNDFTFMLNGNIISFSSDGTVKRVQDGEVIESKGFNWVRNGNFMDGTSGWISGNGTFEMSIGKALTKGTSDQSYQYLTQSRVFNSSHAVYLRAKVKSLNDGTNSFFQMHDGVGNRLFDARHSLTKNEEFHLSGLYKPRDGHSQNNIYVQIYQMREDGGPIEGYKFEVSNIMAIDLTEVFGAGNEPTKEQMDAIIDRFGFIPNTQDLIDPIEYKGNDLGDMENIIDGLYKTEVLSGEEVYTDKSDDSVVHVEIDGKSYQDGVPTPDYPVEIHSLNDFYVVSSAVRRNLIVSSDVTPSTYIESNGTLTRTAGHFITGFIEVKANEFYTISMLLQRNRYSRVAYYDLDKNFIKRDLFQNQEVTQIKPEQDGFIRWSPDVDGAISDYTPGYIIELGTDHSLIDKINLLLSEPLRSVEDIKDRLFRDSDGLWKIERNVGEHIADENTIVSAGNQASGYIYFDTLANYNISNIKHSHSSFKSTNLNNIVKGNFSLSSSKDKYAIGYPTSNTVQGLKDWIADEKRKGTPVTFMYELESSQIEFLSDELQEKLNNLRSFEDSNYVYTILTNEDNHLSENLKPTLHAKFLYNNWYKEDRVINNLMIYNRALTNEEMLQNYKAIKRRWGM